MVKLLEWQALEYTHRPKTKDWYWAVVIIFGTAAIISLMLHDAVFAILLVVSAFAVCVHAARPPEVVTCEVNTRGMVVNDRLYPFMTLHSFWIEMYHHTPHISLRSKKLLMPIVTIPLGEVDRERIRAALLGYLREEEHERSLSLAVVERLGF